MTLVAVAGGLYVVPLNALLQQRSDEQHLARNIAKDRNCGDRSGLSTFPPPQTGRATFTASGFPADLSGWVPYYGATALVANYPYGVGRARMAQGHAPIRLPHCIGQPRFTPGLPGRPSPCPGHYSQAFGYCAASALSPAHWHSRTLPKQVKPARVPQFRHQCPPPPLAACYMPSGLRSNPRRTLEPAQPPPSHFGQGVSVGR